MLLFDMSYLHRKIFFFFPDYSFPKTPRTEFVRRDTNAVKNSNSTKMFNPLEREALSKVPMDIMCYWYS